MEHEQIAQWLLNKSSGVDRSEETIEQLSGKLTLANAKIEHQAARIRYLEGATNHATDTPLSKVTDERNKLSALVGTIRSMLNVPIRNVTDITPEQHSREIGAAINRLRLEDARLRHLIDGLRDLLTEAQAAIPQEHTGSRPWPYKNIVVDDSLPGGVVDIIDPAALHQAMDLIKLESQRDMLANTVKMMLYGEGDSIRNIHKMGREALDAIGMKSNETSKGHD